MTRMRATLAVSIMLIDLHVHTTRGSGDSSLTPEEVVQEAKRIGLAGACFTEHSGGWERLEFQRFADAQRPLLLVRALEVETNMGHVTVFGLDGYVPGMQDAEELRRVADGAGAYMVAAHPFRGLFDGAAERENLLFKESARYPETVEEAAEHPIFKLVDAIEAANGGNTDRENSFALEVAHYLGKPMVGGSDAHSINGLGACVTVFPAAIGSQREFLEALRAGGFYPATGLPTGNVQPLRATGS